MDALLQGEFTETILMDAIIYSVIAASESRICLVSSLIKPDMESNLQRTFLTSGLEKLSFVSGLESCSTSG